MPARNTLVQLLAPVYTNPESHNAQRHRQTETDRQTDDRIAPTADSYKKNIAVCIAVVQYDRLKTITTVFEIFLQKLLLHVMKWHDKTA